MKPFERTDPMALVAMPVPDGDLEAMAECVVEEYLLLGWSPERLMLLFSRQCFGMTHFVYRQRGEAWVRSLIDRVCDRWSANAAHGGSSNA